MTTNNKTTHEVTLNDKARTKLKVMKTDYGYWSDELQNYLDARTITSVKAI